MPFLALDGAEPRELGADTSVGSGSQATLRIQHKDLAARHFSVRLGGDGTARLVPASAQNVVILNGEQVAGAGTELKPGDVIGAGTARFVFLAAADAPVPSAATGDHAPHLVDAAERRGYPLRKRVVQIGREIGCNIVLRDPTVSRFHADIRAEGGEHVIYSTGSTGTRLNGRELRTPQMLREGDQVEIGDTTFTFTKAALPPGIKVVQSTDSREDKLNRKGTVVMQRAVSVDAREFSRTRSLAPVLLGAAAVIIALIAAIAFN